VKQYGSEHLKVLDIVALVYRCRVRGCGLWSAGRRGAVCLRLPVFVRDACFMLRLVSGGSSNSGAPSSLYGFLCRHIYCHNCDRGY